MPISTNNISKSEIQHLIMESLVQLYYFDEYLICHRDYNGSINHVSERGIVFRLGIYMQRILEQNQLFKGYNLDSEYNRNIDGSKSIPHVTDGAYPDLVIHKRSVNHYNLLVIEIKPWWEQSQVKIAHDIDKLKDFTMPKVGNSIYEYGYKYGLFIKLAKSFQGLELTWLQNGEPKPYENLDR